jgi:hypothetical protein
MSLALLADAPCGDCGALLEQGQRYCVHCGARRPDAEDPALAWIAEGRARAAYATPAPAPPARNPLAVPALSLLALPLAVAVGVLVGHHGNGNDQQLIDALRSQKAPVVKVGGVAAAGTPVASAPAKKAKASTKGRDRTGGQVVATTQYGVAHQVSGYKPTASKVQSDKRLVQKINNSIGGNYLQAQRNLPDTIVVSPGSAGGSSPAAQGRGD